MLNHQVFMRRCFDLARLGAGSVSPNPMVGAVLVYENRIIGEGWHQKYGGAHAEVNAVNNVKEADRHLIKASTIYVSLEPCNIHGNTPPCTGLIIKEGIKKVVISCIDTTPEVKGLGIEMLEQAGVEVEYGILESVGRKISAFRNTFTSKKRPFIQLKFAQSLNGFIGIPGQQVWISNLFSKRATHKMRAEFDAILIGTQTALTDNPQLSNRLYFGKSPLRVILDRNLTIPEDSEVFKGNNVTLIVTEQPTPVEVGLIHYRQINFDDNLLNNLLVVLADMKVTSLIVEGGAFTLGQFIKHNLWDKAWVFTGNKVVENGIPAPKVSGHIAGTYPLGGDNLSIFYNTTD